MSCMDFIATSIFECHHNKELCVIRPAESAPVWCNQEMEFKAHKITLNVHLYLVQCQFQCISTCVCTCVYIQAPEVLLFPLVVITVQMLCKALVVSTGLLTLPCTAHL